VLARVTSLISPQDRIDDRIDLIHERLVPDASRLMGFGGGAWLVDRDLGRFMAVTYWKDQEHLDGSESAVENLRDLAREQVGGTLEWVRRLEVVTQV
jgi:hypothetical protein